MAGRMFTLVGALLAALFLVAVGSAYAAPGMAGGEAGPVPAAAGQDGAATAEVNRFTCERFDWRN